MLLKTRKIQEDTVGSRFNSNMAYIAGFLDGDGSLMFQIKTRKDTKSKVRPMVTICFYQDTRHEKSLFWIKDTLKVGYISRRNDKITELRIQGYSVVESVLKKLSPYIKFKKIQCKVLLKACGLLTKKCFSDLTQRDKIRLANYLLEIQSVNYVSKGKKSREQVFQLLNLTP